MLTMCCHEVRSIPSFFCCPPRERAPVNRANEKFVHCITSSVAAIKQTASGGLFVCPAQAK
jgi:hypothetical protein